MTLLILLAIGMLLVNLVATAFWQRSLLQTQIETEKRNLRIYGGMFSEQDKGSSLELQKIRQLTDERYVDIAYYDGQSLSYALSSANDIAKVVLAAAAGREDIVRFCSREFDIFPRFDCARIAVTLDRGKAIGVDVRLHSVSPFRGDEQRYILVYILVNTVILVVIGLIRMHDLVFRPIEKLVEMTENYSVDETEFFFPEKTKNEFGVLSSSLNLMLKKIEADKSKLCALISTLEDTNKQLASTQNEIIIAEKMAAVGLLSAGIAHEIGNPLCIVQGYIELLANNELSPNERKQFSERALSEIDRVDGLIRQLLNYARTNPKDIVNASVTSTLREVVDAVKVNSNSQDIMFISDVKLSREVGVRDGSGLRQVLINCLFNAIDAIREKNNKDGTIEISCSEIDQDRISIKIRDNGIGMTSDQVLSAFDPFYTTKDRVRGSGLGLFVSYSIIKAAKGNMWLDSLPGHGTTVHLVLSSVNEI